jgi:hypothetical protein
MSAGCVVARAHIGVAFQPMRLQKQVKYRGVATKISKSQRRLFLSSYVCSRQDKCANIQVSASRGHLPCVQFFAEGHQLALGGDESGQIQDQNQLAAAVFTAVDKKDNLMFDYLLAKDFPRFPTLDLTLYDLASRTPSAYVEYREIVHTAFRFNIVGKTAATLLLRLAEDNEDTDLLALAAAAGIVPDSE